MKPYRALVTLTALLLSLSIRAVEPDKIIGRYMSHGKDAKFNLYRDGNVYHAEQIYSKNYGGDTCKRVLVLRNLLFDADKEVWSGKIYDPRFDKQYNVKVKLLPDGSMEVNPWWGPIKMSFIWPRLPQES